MTKITKIKMMSRTMNSFNFFCILKAIDKLTLEIAIRETNKNVDINISGEDIFTIFNRKEKTPENK
ncbi:hypothetical protein BA744_25965 [Vibrio parahaemolyticus]|nr:hypothetical protein BA745_10000 [Vibrio parahaemolyticus]OTW28253.1 hypothetical protein BA744_25965 [Vibrio parahaemolyticus]